MNGALRRFFFVFFCLEHRCFCDKIIKIIGGSTLKKTLLVSAIIMTGFGTYAATPRSAISTSTSRGSSGRNVVVQTAPASTSTTRAVAARSVTQPQSTASLGASGNVQRGRSATAPVSNARAAKQSVISTGTKVATATQNTAVDQVCWEKFSGCMDSFCMLDNANGGRCICSDQNAQYDAILEEIQKLDEQSYQMATAGVERIEMGDAADAVISKTNAVTKNIEKETTKAQSKRPSLDLSAWDVNSIDFDSEVEDMFSISSDGLSIEGKEGDALYRVSAKLCNAQLPECGTQSKMMELMYKQRIRSDCTAYENSLRQQRTQSAQKLAAAQSAMREAALEQYRNANKYDLGQCTVQFKQCMQTTGGCGDDFSGCVEWSVREGLVKGTKLGTKTIKGTASQIELSAATYDVLLGKKELCMNVTDQCVNVRDQVWDTFLREVAPQVKSAELMVESDMRTSCISNIAACFQKACRDNIDPNDPDGSYDMCLTRPETLQNACRVEIEPCEGGIPNIMDYVRARLASMRVDSCTREFKECLTSEDRCGKDYTQCVGLDYDTILKMCPEDKLVGCYNSNKPDQDVYDELKTIAQGIFLNIDNNMLKTCQKAVQNKVLEVCGSLSECDAFEDDDIIGTDSLVSYKNSNGDTVIEGLMNYGLLKINDSEDNNGINTYDIDHTGFSFLYDTGRDGSVAEKTTLGRIEQRIKSSVNTVSNKIKQKINVIAADTTIDMCVNGRSGAWRGNDSNQSTSRFPHLLDSYELMIFNSGLDKAYENYKAKYDKLVADALKSQSDDEKAAICTMLANNGETVTCNTDEDGETRCVTDGTGTLSSIIEQMYASTGDTIGIQDDGLSYIIQGAKLTEKLKLLSKNRGQMVKVDKWGNMLALVQTEALYGSGICKITTTTKTCAHMKDIISLEETDYVKEKNDSNGNRTKYVCDDCKEKFDGVMCTEYSDPITTVNEIEM